MVQTLFHSLFHNKLWCDQKILVLIIFSGVKVFDHQQFIIEVSSFSEAHKDMIKRYCVIDCESDDMEPIRYGEMFRSNLEDSKNQETWVNCHIALGESLPEDLMDFQAVIISGSHFNCRDHESIPWFEGLCDFICKAAEKGTPRIFAGCFGSQLTAFALGGEVDYNPSKKFVFKSERVTCLSSPAELEKIQQITSQYPIPARWFTSGLGMFESHGDCVRKLPPGAQLAASSETCEVEMYFAGKHFSVVAAQSHPEYDLQFMLNDILWKDPRDREKEFTPEEIATGETSFTTYKVDDATEFLQWLKRFLSH